MYPLLLWCFSSPPKLSWNYPSFWTIPCIIRNMDDWVVWWVYWERKGWHLYTSYILFNINYFWVLTLDIVNNKFDVVLIFSGIRWTPMQEHEIIKTYYVALEHIFLGNVAVVASLNATATILITTTLLPHRGSITHFDGSVSNTFVLIMLRLLLFERSNWINPSQ